MYLVSRSFFFIPFSYHVVFYFEHFKCWIVKYFLFREIDITMNIVVIIHHCLFICQLLKLGLNVIAIIVPMVDTSLELEVWLYF